MSEPLDPKHRSRALTEGPERAPARAYLKGIGFDDEALSKPIVGVASTWLAPLVEHLFGPGLGLLPEVFDGDAPHRPGGCVAQAWSVGEVLRAVLRTGA